MKYLQSSGGRVRFSFLNSFAVLALLAFAFSLAAVAADTHSGKFTLNDTVRVGSAQLAPGDYKAEWSGPADSLKVDILSHGKTIATTGAKMVDLQHPSPYSAVTLKPTDNNAKTLDQIQFNNRSEVLVFTGE